MTTERPAHDPLVEASVTAAERGAELTFIGFFESVNGGVGQSVHTYFLDNAPIEKEVLKEIATTTNEALGLLRL